MLNYDLRLDDGILVLRPEGPLAATDFTTLAGHVDAYLSQHGTLHGVMVRANGFPGWQDFGALLAHLKFVREHHGKIEKVAVVADGTAATVLPYIADHFLHAQLKHFDPAQESAAWIWLWERRPSG